MASLLTATAGPMSSPPPETGYFRTVMTSDLFRDLDSSTLAVPSEDKLGGSGQRHRDEKSSRIQQQIRLTMHRKSRKGSAGQGNMQRANSVPEQFCQLDHSDYGFVSNTAGQNYYHYKENVMGFSSLGYENGHAVGYGTRGTAEMASQRQPLRRLEISSEDSPRMAQFSQQGFIYSPVTKVGSFGMNLNQAWYQQSVRPTTSVPRYARSDTMNVNRYETSKRGNYSIYQRPNSSYQVGRGGGFLDNFPNSPNYSGFLGATSSRGMNNTFEKDNCVSPRGAVGSVRGMVNRQYMTQMQFQKLNEQQGFVMNRSKETSQAPSASSCGVEGSQQRMTMRATGNELQSQRKMTFSEGQQGISQVDGMQTSQTESIQLTLQRAANMLMSENPSFVITGATFIQHECFQKSEAKMKVLNLGAIPRLLNLLESDDIEIQRVACGALRNIVYEDNDNKLEVHEHDGVSMLLRLLKQTKDTEIKKQITGLLWNLSSNDHLKNTLIKDALQTMTETIIVPYSGWSEGDYPKREVMFDQDILYNATGCLRNMSSAGPEQRKRMRDCDGLIDSLIHYSRATIADYKPDDKSVENCICILHNLSYQLESELPSQHTQNIYKQNQTTFSSSKGPGCFGTRSKKVKENLETVSTMPEEKSNPKGVEWLWHSIVVRMYLSLIAKSSRNYTQEASLGALQNLTAGNGPMPFAVAQTVIQKENGLQHIRKMLYSNDQGVKKAAISLLRNASRNPSLHKEMARDVLPDLISILPDSTPSSSSDNENAASAIHVMHSLIQMSPQNARTLLDYGGLRKIIGISRSDSNMSTKAGRAASAILQTMWMYTELHSAYKKANLKKSDFINERTKRAIHSL